MLSGAKPCGAYLPYAVYSVTSGHVMLGVINSAVTELPAMMPCCAIEKGSTTRPAPAAGSGGDGEGGGGGELGGGGRDRVCAGPQACCGPSTVYTTVPSHVPLNKYT